MPRQPDFFEKLSRDVLDAFESYAREPGVTVDDCVDWLANRKVEASRSAVARWKKRFDAEDKFRASNEVARGLMEAAKSQGTVAISDAATLQLSQMLFEQLLKLQADEKVSTKELWGASMALKNVITGKRHVEKLKGEISEALKAVDQEAKSGASGEAVVSRVREILGIT